MYRNDSQVKQNHGVYNTGANIIDGCDELEHQALDSTTIKGKNWVRIVYCSPERIC